MTRSFSQTQLKWLAAAFMTLDHIGVYLRAFPAVGAFYDVLRVLGRIAAPIFLYCMVESVRHTRSRRALLARLAFWNTVTVLLFTMANLLLFLPVKGAALSIPRMLMTFFYLAVLIMLSDSVLDAWQQRSLRRMLQPAAVCAVLGALYFAQPHLLKLILAATGSQPLADLFAAIVPRPFCVLYTPIFLLLGLAWYYMRDSRAQAGLLLACNLLCIAGVAAGFTQAKGFFNPTQRWMFLALPFLLLYNGERGKVSRGGRIGFYLYYPLHILALAAISLAAA